MSKTYHLSSQPLLIVAVLFGLGVCPYAQAGIAIVVNTANQNSWEREPELIQKQIKEIFLGKLDKFPDGSRAQPVDQAESQAHRNEFYAKLANKDESEMNAYWSSLIFTGNGRPPKVLTGDGDVKKFIKENTGGIGYIDQQAVDSSVKTIYVLK